MASAKTRLGRSDLFASQIGVGTSGLAGWGPNNSDEIISEAKLSILHAINNGVNFIDTAPFYNDRWGERRLGEIIRNESINRDDLIISTKIGRYSNIEQQRQWFDYSANTINESVQLSLRELKLSYLDVLAIHDVEFLPDFQTLVNETLPTMIKLKEQGVVRALSITGFSLKHLRRVCEVYSNEIDIIQSYQRYNLIDQSLSEDLSFYCEKQISVINASPFGIGLLADDPKIVSWHPAPEQVQQSCRQAVQFCQSKGFNISRLALRYSVENPDIDVTLWSTRNVKHMESNIDAALTPLNSEEIIARREVMRIINEGKDKSKDWNLIYEQERKPWSL